MDTPGTSDAASARWRWLGLAVGVIGLAAMWRFTSLATWLDPAVLAERAAPLRQSAFAPLIVIAIYVIASLLVMPMTALVVAVGMLFGPLRGITYTMIGIMLSAAVNYAIGRWVGGNAVGRMMGGRLGALNRQLADRGVLAVAALRVVPMAPFTVVNVAAGAAAISLRDFMLGTFLGTVPGIVMINVFAEQLNQTVRNADPKNIALLIGATLALIASGIAVRRYRQRRRV